ncbi:fluoride efflux transporter CrcB [Robiginitalea aurantiaca]|uniref:Fluoride-specific ion channel FluC n=1 Tax=Robiginitalea aurantiaca TaxID=3056915 RepID=A0ABT7WD66_9FLAO|nr:fluoride efflux transporter CrcB [Robiginitalea aurantiaca]MDM9630853.1 fluoride efflux transporter CrcB [Robiginitalea aurantiaca]
MKHLLLIFLGGGTGSALRYLISGYLNSSESQFYFGTFLVNILGCLLLGFLVGLSLKENSVSGEVMLLLGVGFCGGFTTFSTFGMEMFTLLREENYAMFFRYTGGSLIIGLLSTALGFWLSRSF